MSDPTPNPNPAPAVDDAPPQHLKRIGIFYIILPILLIYIVFLVFPPVPWPSSKDSEGKVKLVEPQEITLPFGVRKIPTTWEERLLLLVIAAGALGSYIHSATSFADYVGNKKFTRSWTWWYLLRPMIGVALALIVYFVVRGGFLLLVGGSQPEAHEINAFGIAALAGLVGMFSKQATDKLDEVFTTIFKAAPGKGDDKRGDSLTGIVTLQVIDPKSGPTVGGTEVTITGNGFSEGAGVFFADQPAAAVVVVSTTVIKAKTPPHAAGMVEVSVVNTDNQKGALKEGYIYVEAGAEGGGAAAAAAPTVSKVAPDSGSTEGGAEATITGTNFADGAAVSFGEMPSESVTFIDDKTLIVLTPGPAAAGPVAVTVTNPDGLAGTQPSAFTYTAEG